MEPGERGQSVGGATEGQPHTAVGQALCGTRPQHAGAVQPCFLSCHM